MAEMARIFGMHFFEHRDDIHVHTFKLLGGIVSSKGAEWKTALDVAVALTSCAEILTMPRTNCDSRAEL